MYPLIKSPHNGFLLEFFFFFLIAHAQFLLLFMEGWNCLFQEPDKQTQFQDSTDQYVKWLNKRKVRSFYTQFTANTLRDGVRYLMQVGPLFDKQLLLTTQKKLENE